MHLKHPLVPYCFIMALTLVGKAWASYQIDIDKCGKDMRNFFQADRFFFEPYARLLYRKWQSSPLLEKMIVSGRRRAFNNETSCLSLFFIDFFFQRKYHCTSWEISYHPMSLVSHSLNHFGVTDFYHLIAM